MPFVARRTLAIVVTLLAVAILAVAAFIWSGIYDVGADDPHWRSTRALLQWGRQRSIATRASHLQAPVDLASLARIRQGAGNYAAMCTGCHLAPGMADTEMRRGLYPQPPALAQQHTDPAQAFWVIKHGIKATGMPAWGRSMEDVYIWNLVAFVQALPTLDARQYQALVESSEGHSHGGGETHADGHEGEHVPAHEHEHEHPASAPMSGDQAASAKETPGHRHAHQQ